jgi:two-component system NtrC family sensor kinase
MLDKSYFTRLRLKIILTTLGFSIIPLLILGFTLVSRFEAAYYGKVNTNLQHLVENKKRTIDLFLNERIAQLATIANTHSLKYLSDPANMERIMSVVQSRSKYYIDLGIIDQDGNHVAYSGPYQLKNINYKNEDWFRKCMAQGVYVSDVFLGYRKYPHFIIAVSRREGDQTWIMRATIDSDVFENLVQTVHLGKRGDAFLLNSENVLQTKTRFGGAMLEKMDLPPASRFNGARVESVTVQDTETLMASIWLDNKDWILVVRDDPAEEIQPLSRARTTGFAALFGGLVLLVAGAVLISQSMINQLIEAERRRATLDAGLTQSSKMAALGKMAAGVAHEVNNPLAIIKEQAGWMRDLLSEADVKHSPNFQEFELAVGKIEFHVGRAKDITHRLLGFARRMDPVQEDVNVNVLLSQTITFLETEARFREIELHTNFRDDVPLIASDPSQLQQVFLNIIDNALDAIEKNGRVNIASDYLPSTNEVQVVIADTGPGIPKDKLDKIFDPFFTTKKVGEGTGLGLAISYSIIEKLGGQLLVASEPGKGATFTILLPAK